MYIYIYSQKVYVHRAERKRKRERERESAYMSLSIFGGGPRKSKTTDVCGSIGGGKVGSTLMGPCEFHVFDRWNCGTPLKVPGLTFFPDPSKLISSEGSRVEGLNLGASASHFEPLPSLPTPCRPRYSGCPVNTLRRCRMHAEFIVRARFAAALKSTKKKKKKSRGRCPKVRSGE